jgi:hypothetical protein
MTENFSDHLVNLCKNKILSSAQIRGWLERSLNKGTLDNLMYIECLNAINEYDEHNKTRTESV